METAPASRSRNLWSAEEDKLLRRLVESHENDKVDWRLIASYLPGRNNKDCRKRWHYRVSASMNLGPWSQQEDDLLKIGIQRHGTHWSRVAQVVGTRNGDQCFKRWNDVLDPGIDRSPWTRDEDQLLLFAIGKYGRSWKQIVDTHFPGRTGLDAKNRHRQLTRKRKREEKLETKERGSETPAPPALGGSQTQQQPVPSFTSILKHNHDASLDVQSANSMLATPQPSPHFDEHRPTIQACPDWKFTSDALLSPQLPTTPYSSCSNSSISNSGSGSMSEMDEYFSQQMVASSRVEQGSDLLNAVSDPSFSCMYHREISGHCVTEPTGQSAGYPFFPAMPGDPTLGVRQEPNYVGVLDLRPNTVPVRPMSFWNTGWNVAT